MSCIQSLTPLLLLFFLFFSSLLLLLVLPVLTFLNYSLIEHINSRSRDYGVRVQYSTLSEYFSAITRSKTQFPVFQGDFLR